MMRRYQPTGCEVEEEEEARVVFPGVSSITGVI